MISFTAPPPLPPPPPSHSGASTEPPHAISIPVTIPADLLCHPRIRATVVKTFVRQLMYDRGQVPDLQMDLPPPSSSYPLTFQRNSKRVTSSSRQRTKCLQKLSDILHSVDAAFQQSSTPPAAALLTFGPSHSSYKEQYLLRFASPIHPLSAPPPEPAEAILQKVSRRCMRSFVSCLHEEDALPPSSSLSQPPPPPNYDFSHLLLAMPGIHSFRISLLAKFTPDSPPPQELVARPRFSPRVRRRNRGRPPLCVIDVLPIKPQPEAHLLTSQPGEEGDIWWECKVICKGWRDKEEAK
ncbi:hypothetical protein TrRE_jg13095 [Triparma retinervis]|uniref:Uncharacterized protein n=1 Tax=Triparma retinervis TaxID=2557542 RepID=A0A9W6ZRR3_9STRA|nr:hypothetical protein TrRE_jg13095 [Triparma retinervis]